MEIQKEPQVSNPAKGVSWDKRERKWRVRICSQGTIKELGFFRSTDAAIAAYALARKKLLQSGAIQLPVDPAETRRRWKAANKDSVAKSNKQYRLKNKEKLQLYDRKKIWELRLELIRAYGGKCTCCGETTAEFLTIDHVGGEGGMHRKTLGITGGHPFYLWLKRQGFPKDGYRLCCYNCNCARGHFGYCPHHSIGRTF